MRARAKTPSRRTGSPATLRALLDGGGSSAATRGLLALSVLILLTAFPSSAIAAPVAPQIKEVRVLEADQNSATLEARINPSGAPTTYRLEWGSTVAYGSSVPADFSPFVGEGENAIRVSATISGLSGGSTYHYRFVARNEAGITLTPDQTVETLDSCGLPAGRCFEMVSPPEVGLVGTPGYNGIIQFKAATSGPGALAYTVQNGLADATSGGEVLYEGVRDPAGWTSVQLAPPLEEPDITGGGASRPSQVLVTSDDLSCALVTTSQLLTSDLATRPQVEAGGYNIYRRNSDGTYTAISNLAPLNRGGLATLAEEYQPLGMSAHCDKVVFASEHVYPGIAGAGELRLYEWEEGTLRNVGFVPGPGGGQVVAEATGVPDSVSADGSKVFFTAASQTGNDSGKQAVFVRLNGSQTLDISQSPLAVDTGAVYQGATSDGSRVFFTANAGLTAKTSSTGTDLYEYDFGRPEGERLADLSVTTEPFGAAVAGLVGASADGSIVYFAAQGQLVAGKGRSFFENLLAGTYSLYVRSGVGLGYVGSFGSGELARVTVPTGNNGSAWSSRVSPDGRYLLFESSKDVTGYQSGGLSEAYLFDADAAGSEPTVCISCVSGGNTSVASAGDRPLFSAEDLNQRYEVNNPQSLVERTGKARAYFRSPDKLAPGATEGVTNLYEWANDQVFLLASEPPKVSANLPLLGFAGASTDGTDVYLATSEPLTWEDRDERSSVYDARIGGGFPQPAAPPAPCDPNGEGSCQGSSSSPPGAPAASSATFIGPGNVKSSKCKKGFVAHHGRCVKKHVQKRTGHKNKRRANKKRDGGMRKRSAEADRRAGK